jgi:hypothetical protein
MSLFLKNSILLFFVFAEISLSYSQNQPKTILSINNNCVFFTSGDSTRLTVQNNHSNQLILFAFHAEEDSIGMDPGLSTTGRWRAIHLGQICESLPFKGFFTTPFRNNILTLQPMVDKRSEKLSYYDQADLQVLTEQINRLNPAPVIVIVHPETADILFEKLTKQKFPYSFKGNLSEKLILIQRTGSSTNTFEFRYPVR